MIHPCKETVQTQSSKDCQKLSEKIKLQALEFEKYCMNSSSDELLKESLHQMIWLCKHSLDEFEKKQQSEYKNALKQRKDELVSKLLKKK